MTMPLLAGGSFQVGLFGPLGVGHSTKSSGDCNYGILGNSRLVARSRPLFAKDKLTYKRNPRQQIRFAPPLKLPYNRLDLEVSALEKRILMAPAFGLMAALAVSVGPAPLSAADAYQVIH